MKYRAVVNAGRNWKSLFGEGDEYRQIAERCVYLEASDLETAAERAKWVVQAIYPEANAFDVYNVVDEWREPDSVLEFVVGSSATEVLVDQSPIVMWQFQESKPAQWEHRAQKNGALRNAMNPTEKRQRELADEEAILVEYKEQLKRATERVNEQEARLRLLREVLTLETEEQSASTDK